MKNWWIEVWRVNEKDKFIGPFKTYNAAVRYHEKNLLDDSLCFSIVRHYTNNHRITQKTKKAGGIPPALNG